MVQACWEAYGGGGRKGGGGGAPVVKDEKDGKEGKEGGEGKEGKEVAIDDVVASNDVVKSVRFTSLLNLLRIEYNRVRPSTYLSYFSRIGITFQTSLSDFYGVLKSSSNPEFCFIHVYVYVYVYVYPRLPF